MQTDSVSQVVLMCGISGSGKTTYARKLEEQGYLRLSVDKIVWAQLGAAFADLEEKRRMEIFRQANTELLVALERALADGKNVVVDTTLCRREKRDAIRRLCHSFRIEPRLVYLRADADVLRNRLSLRTGSGPDDQLVPEEHLSRFCRNFEEPTSDEHPLIIDQH